MGALPLSDLETQPRLQFLGFEVTGFYKRDGEYFAALRFDGDRYGHDDSFLSIDALRQTIERMQNRKPEIIDEGSLKDLLKIANRPMVAPLGLPLKEMRVIVLSFELSMGETVSPQRGLSDYPSAQPLGS